MSVLEDELAFQIKVLGGNAETRLPEPVREYRFAKPRRWRFDFAWPDRLVAVEVDGGSWVGGRHTRGAGFHNDCEKLSTAAAMGWRVLRFDRQMVEDASGILLLSKALAQLS